MNLEELKQLDWDANKSEQGAKHLTACAKDIAGTRNGDKHLREGITDLVRYDSGGTRERVLRFAEQQVRDDLLRIAELMLEAEARAMTTKARALRSQLAAYLDQPHEAAQ